LVQSVGKGQRIDTRIISL